MCVEVSFDLLGLVYHQVSFIDPIFVLSHVILCFMWHNSKFDCILYCKFVVTIND